MEAIIGLIILLLIPISVFLYIIMIHKNAEKRWDECRNYISNEYIDSVLVPEISLKYDPYYDYVYSGSELPLGRASAFLNYFHRTIYTEEPYMFYCKRSSNDDEFREYGCILARTGIYLSKENIHKSNRKDGYGLTGEDEYIDFTGLIHIFSLGSIIVAINYNENRNIDDIKFISVNDSNLRHQIKEICKAVIKHDFGICLQKNLVTEIIEDETLLSETDDEKYSDQIEVLSIDDESDVFNETEKKLDSELYDKSIEGAGVQANIPRFNNIFGRIKGFMNGSRGHGYAAEYGANAIDRVLGRKVEDVSAKLDNNGRQIKAGADRIVNGLEIQTKYYKTASETIGAAFENKQAKYLRTDGSGKMMQIEVPRDQFNEALKLMQKRIDSGQVPNVSPGENARNYVRKGFFTYEQSFNIARAGTIESLTVDAITGAITCFTAAGVTSAIIFALAVWRGSSPKEAAKQCLSTSLTIMGKGTLIYTLTMQLSRKEVALVFAGKVFTADGISQGYKAITNPIYTSSEKIATRISGSNLAKTHVGQMFGLDTLNGRRVVGGTVTLAVVFGPDVLKAMRGKISTKQLFKNASVAAAGMAGAAAAQAAVPVIPVIPAIVGGATAGFVAKKTLDHFIEDDAKEMFRILKEEFIDMTMLTPLNKDEFDEVVDMTVGSKKVSKMLQSMYQSEDHRRYARESIMQEAIIKTLKHRTKISKKEYQRGLIELVGETV